MASFGKYLRWMEEGNMIFILEDNEDRIRAFAEALSNVPHHVERTVPKAIEWLSLHMDRVKLCTLDNDLTVIGSDGTEGEGWQLLEWLLKCPSNTSVIIHTSNFLAATKMELMMEEAGRDYRRVVPYGGYVWISESWIWAVSELLGDSDRVVTKQD